MRFRTFFILFVGFVAVTAIAVTVLENLPILEEPFLLIGQRSLPMYGVLVLVFLLGLSLTVVISILQDSSTALERLRRWWGARTRRAMEARYRQGMEALLGGEDERALRAFGEVLASHPDHFEALMVSGDALRALKRFDDAVQRHRRARRLRPDDLSPLYSLASDYEESKQYAKARLALNKIVNLEPRKSISALRRLRKLHMKEGDWKSALEFQEKIENVTEKNPYKLEAERRYGLGIRYQLARQMADTDRPEEGVANLEKVLLASPEFVPARLWLGEAQRRGQDPDGAVDTWREGFRITRSPIFLTTLEEHFLEMENPQVAIDTFRSLMAGSSDDALPRFFLGKLFLRLEMIDDAYREFDKLRARVSRSPALHYYLGKVLARRNDFRSAAEEYEAALEQVDLMRLQYGCSVCSTKHSRWIDRCDICGEWNTVGIDLPEDRTAEELGLAATPVYSA